MVVNSRDLLTGTRGKLRIELQVRITSPEVSPEHAERAQIAVDNLSEDVLERLRRTFSELDVTTDDAIKCEECQALSAMFT